jgi:hypothetical protein
MESRSCAPRRRADTLRPRGVFFVNIIFRCQRKSAIPRKIPSCAGGGRTSPGARPQVRACLPASWALEVQEEVRRGGATFDALLILSGPDGSSTTVAVEAKGTMTTRDAARALEQLRLYIDAAALEPALPMLVARYLPPPTRERLERESVAYADATGNLRLIERWSEDYGFMRSEVVQSFLFPRGVEKVPEVLASAGELRYVLAGSLAAQSFAPYAPPRVAMIYVDDVPAAAGQLGLRSVDRGANVLLAAQRDDVSFLRTRRVDGVVTAAPSQVAVDLLTGPGRSPSEGQAGLDWMESHEREWRA